MDLRTRDGRREQGELIKAAASAAGLTLKELATRLGVSHALIYQYVSGANLAQPDKLQEIAHLTGVPVSHFFGEAAAAPGTAQTPTTPAAPATAEPAARAQSPPSVPAAPVVDSARVQGTVRQLEVLAQAQDAAGRDLRGLLRTLEQMLGLARLTGEQRREAELLHRIGNARTDAGELKGASEALVECLALYRDLDMPQQALSATQSLARCLSLMGSLVEAERLFREVAVSSNADLSWRGLLGLGQILEQREQYDAALNEFERAREVVEGLPDGESGGIRPYAEMYVRTNVANVYMAEGDFTSAVPLWQHNLEQAEDLSLPDQFLEALVSEGVCHFYVGRPGLAYEFCKRAIRLCRLLGDNERLAVGRACLAEVLAAAGLYEESKEFAREAAKLSLDIGASRGAGLANLALARSLIMAGQAESARFYIETEERSSNLKTRVSALLLRSEMLLHSGDFQASEDAARLALEALDDVGALHLERAAWTAVALAAARRSDNEAAAEALEQADKLSAFTRGVPDTGWQLPAAQARHHRNRSELDEAISAYQTSIHYIQGMRSDFEARGVLETCLDDPEKLQIYVDAITAARSVGRDDIANAILDEADWPPLADALAVDVSPVSDSPVSDSPVGDSPMGGSLVSDLPVEASSLNAPSEVGSSGDTSPADEPSGS